MKLYVALCSDRHIDPVLRVFSTPQAAISYAREFMQVNARRPGNIEEEPIEGWLFHATFSPEGDDYVRVEEVELDATD